MGDVLISENQTFKDVVNWLILMIRWIISLQMSQLRIPIIHSKVIHSQVIHSTSILTRTFMVDQKYIKFMMINGFSLKRPKNFNKQSKILQAILLLPKNCIGRENMILKKPNTLLVIKILKLNSAQKSLNRLELIQHIVKKKETVQSLK